MDLTPEEPASEEATAADPARPFAPQPTLALDHPPPINVETGTGAHGQPAPQSRAGHTVRPLEAGGLRVVIIVWCLWLLGSWVMAVLADDGVPMVRWMLLASFVGVMLVWPAARLSQETHPHEPGNGALQAFLDWLAMMLVFQAVIWSLRFHAGWTIERTAWLDAGVVGWSLLIAGIVGWARTAPSGIVRLIAMALCIAAVVVAPLCQLLSTNALDADPSYAFNPMQLLYGLTLRQDQAPLATLTPHVTVVLGAALIGWAAILFCSILSRRLERRRPALAPQVVDIAAGHRDATPSDTMTPGISTTTTNAPKQ